MPAPASSNDDIYLTQEELDKIFGAIQAREMERLKRESVALAEQLRGLDGNGRVP